MSLAGLSAERIAGALRTRRYGRSLEVHDAVASTMDLAHQAGLRDVPDGHLVVANTQLAGRGTRGRTWSSPQGEDLYVSLVIRPDLPLSRLPPITLATGLAVCRTVSDVLSQGGSAEHDPTEERRVLVKWPNDVWIDRRKCAGVLVESSSSGEIPSAVAIGIGLNVNRLSWPPELADAATSLAHASGRRFDRCLILADLLAHLESAVDTLITGGVAHVLPELEPCLALRGERAYVDEREGIVRGLDRDGALLFETPRGLERIEAGRLRPASL